MNYSELVEAKAKGVQVHTYDGIGTLNGLGQAWSYVLYPNTGRLSEYNNEQILVVIESNDEAEPVCPVCGGSLRGNIVETFHDVGLGLDCWNNICWDTNDGEQTEAELVEMTCNECGYTVPDSYRVI